MNDKHEVFCNKCGQAILNNNGYGDYLNISKSWGYFSNKDLQTHIFNLCESCYDDIVKEFIIPIDIKKTNEAI